ncbi:ATP-dependent DNA helicase [Microcella daejeonensis]|uniref:ATP-dependent DNA helicase n=1 Tax=Microcella daejeonensis TaxID=2994971 RepID=UPI00227081D3|nr:ATP-dependent DNA helicase [Microcella daejeonensis]WAB82822.1 ATP-dependent DNA helicase [Microcella daejeonensis]
MSAGAGIPPRPGRQPRISADAIAEAIGQHRPTEEQRAVIEAPLAPALVVAGAGSGKTETMAARVLWLVANEFVRPDEVLGLTFTRKAAGELAHRIRSRLDALGRSPLMARPEGSPPLVDAFTQPAVSTYNAFASTLYRDHAVLIGRDPEGVVLGEASAWQLARELVTRSSDDRLGALDKPIDRITRAVLGLAHGLAEHVAELDDLRALATEFSGLAELPPGGRGAYADVEKLAAEIGASLPVADLVERFRLLKQRDGLVEFADQVGLALQIVQRHRGVIDGLRERYRVVLLDEYQDTNVAQTRLLSALFGGTPVMAVGDPHQSIYGWRGASASNLDDFARRFAVGAVDDSAGDAPAGSPGAAEPGAARFSLSTSWRNGTRILDVANALVEPLSARSGAGGGAVVARLAAGPTASEHPVELAWLEHVEDEADAVARWFAARLGEGAVGAEPGAVDAEGRPLRPSAALLMRNRSTQPVFLAAMRRHEVPVHVLGIGGLLEEPEIADLVSALSVVADPSSGTELVRLLAGPRWRIGLADLEGLRAIASWLRERDLSQRRFSDEVVARMRDSVAPSEGLSIVDALDFVATAREGHSQLERFSEAGRERLREAGALFARLRTRTALALPDLVTAVEHELQLDIEVVANPARVLREAPREAFLDALDGYLGLAEQATLAGFLGWLREAEWRDNLSPRSEEPEPGTVQVLTVHGSKGLEWDHVVVPRFVADELPSKPLGGTTGWLSLGVLPYPLRGDAEELPHFDWRGAETRKELLERRDDFTAAVGAHLEKEERRLAYVAVTRARHRLLLTGSFWSRQTKPRGPSPFLVPLLERGILSPAPPEAPESETNPLVVDEGDEAWWPGDPFGSDPTTSRRVRVMRGADRVRAADASRGSVWDDDITLLLAERAARESRAGRVRIPARVPASAVKDFVTEPEATAERLRRPLPQRPYRATRLGTIFHRWVEQTYGLAATSDAIDGITLDLDALEEGAGEAVEREQLEQLQTTFAASPWGTRTPLDVERELHLVMEGRILVCKIDAVYAVDGAPDRVEIVDWKTGRAPRDADDRRAKELQLALYRLAYARWRGMPLDDVDAVFYFVADDEVLRPTALPDESELRRLWRESIGPAAPSLGVARSATAASG